MLRSGVQRAARRLRLNRLAWQLGLSSEVAFWDAWLRTGGLEWPEDYEHRLEPDSLLQPELVALIDAPEGSSVSILDVGAGPLTSVGKRWPGRRLEIIAVDPLAEVYDQLLRRHGVRPPVATWPGKAERLRRILPAGRFDLVHASNCLDHSIDPMRSLQEMLWVVKPGGYVFMRHVSEEGRRQGYGGLHQWNFSDDHGELIIWNPCRRIQVARELEGIAEVFSPGHEGDVITVALRRRMPRGV